MGFSDVLSNMDVKGTRTSNSAKMYNVTKKTNEALKNPYMPADKKEYVKSILEFAEAIATTMTEESRTKGLGITAVSQTGDEYIATPAITVAPAVDKEGNAIVDKQGEQIFTKTIEYSGKNGGRLTFQLGMYATEKDGEKDNFGITSVAYTKMSSDFKKVEYRVTNKEILSNDKVPADVKAFVENFKGDVVFFNYDKTAQKVNNELYEIFQEFKKELEPLTHMVDVQDKVTGEIQRRPFESARYKRDEEYGNYIIIGDRDEACNEVVKITKDDRGIHISLTNFDERDENNKPKFVWINNRKDAETYISNDNIAKVVADFADAVDKQKKNPVKETPAKD